MNPSKRALLFALVAAALLTGCDSKESIWADPTTTTTTAVTLPTTTIAPLSDAADLKAIPGCGSAKCAIWGRVDHLKSIDGDASAVLVDLGVARPSAHSDAYNLFVISQHSKLLWSGPPNEALGDGPAEKKLFTDKSGNVILDSYFLDGHNAIQVIHVTPQAVQDLSALSAAKPTASHFYANGDITVYDLDADGYLEFQLTNKNPSGTDVISLWRWDPATTDYIIYTCRSDDHKTKVKGYAPTNNAC